jgi:hypothetical protein
MRNIGQPQMKKVLIITYYWPPSGGAGVQRWLKFVKYLREFSWEPIVYTPSNPENPVDDTSLLKDQPKNLEVIQQPIWEPYDLYKKFIGQKPHQKINAGFISENKKPKLSEKISVFVRGNFFIPDARIFWVKPSIKFLNNYLHLHPVEAIISTGPPHSMHLIAHAIHEKQQIPWIADFRDPWTNIDFYKDLKLTKWADKKHHVLEKQILKSATRVITVGRTMATEFEDIAKRSIDVITNGYDVDTNPLSQLDADFTIAHIGSINKDRNPNLLWQVLSNLCKTDNTFNTKLKIKLVGKVDVSVIESLTQFGLQNHLIKIPYLSHDAVVVEQKKSQLLLLLVNNTPNARGILTGKLFEYLAAHRPVICIGDVDGDAAKILHQTEAGITVQFNDAASMTQVILSYFKNYLNGNLQVNTKHIAQYHRKQLTKKLAAILNEITN